MEANKTEVFRKDYHSLVAQLDIECVLSVPNGCVEAYQTAEGWKEFTHIVEMGSSHINGIITNDNAFDVYSISGCKVRTQTTTIEDLPKGVYIINGRKVVKRQ